MHEEHKELTAIESAFSGSDGTWVLCIKDVEDLYEALSFVGTFMREALPECQAGEAGEDEEENAEELDEVFGEINEEDQTLLAAGIGGVNEEDEDEALRLQEQLSRQRQQWERTPPAQDDTDDLNCCWEALERPHRRRRLSSPPQNGPLLTPPPPVLDEDGRPVIPE